MPPPRVFDGPLVILANFASDLAVDLQASAVLSQWALQAPREIWLAHPGDVLLTPIPLSPAFMRYVCSLLEMPQDAISVLTVPDAVGVAMADSVRSSSSFAVLRELVADRPGCRLLPTALDRATVDLAADLGVPIEPYGPGAQSAGRDALAVTALLNTKAGFRGVAHDLGIRLPGGRVCDGSHLPAVVRDLVGTCQRVVVKPDRSAGGYGMRFLGDSDLPLAPQPADSRWVVEEYIAHSRSISAQFHTGEPRARMLFSGEMSTHGGAFTGYRSPLAGIADGTLKELEEWGVDLGGHLAARGYRGPYGVDAMVTSEGELYATEVNVRRTATTTPHAMIARLAHPAPAPAWMTGTCPADRAYTFSEAVGLLAASDLAYDPRTGSGVLLYADAPADGINWRYAIAAPNAGRRRQLDQRLVSLLAPTRAERNGPP